MSDRRVHARHPAGEEIVRYNRQGHWYIEIVPPSPDAPWRGRITIQQAVDRAIQLTQDGFGEIFRGLPGGGKFDYLCPEAK